MLSQTTVTAATGLIHITDGTTTQNTTLTYGSGTITAASTTTGPGGSSSSSTTTVVPVQSAQQAALAAIQAQLTAITNTVNTKGNGLQVSDVLPFLDPAMLNDGENATQFATDVVSSLAGATVALTIEQVKQLTSASADIVVTESATQNGQMRAQPGELFFALVGSSWLITGTGRKFSPGVQSEMRVNQGANAGGNGPDVNVDVTSPKGAFSAMTITGGNLWSGTALTPGATRVTASGQYDSFYINSGALTPSQVPPAGTSFAVSASGSNGQASATQVLNGFTTDPITITNPTGSTLASANLGSSLTVTWNLPTTYAIAYINLDALSFTGLQSNPATFQCDTSAIVSSSATSATLTIPAMCNGQPVLEVNLNLSANGVNGERSLSIYMLQ